MISPAEKEAAVRRVCTALSPPALREVMRSLLMEWGYAVGEDLSDGVVLEGEGNREILFRSRRSERQSLLSNPLDLQSLWRLLEQEFHTPPRQYFRRRLFIPVDLDLGYEESKTNITSLSEMGARFDYPRELVKDQRMALRAEIASFTVVLEGRVIYAVPRGSRSGAFRTETGVVFERLPVETRTLLRNYVLWGFLAAARKRTGREIFEEGSLFLKIPDGVRRMLETGESAGQASL